MVTLIIASLASLMIAVIPFQYRFYKKCHPAGQDRKCCCPE
jgi:hypothetical protein